MSALLGQDPLFIFWFRQDLRLADNSGLVEAAQHGRVLPVYIYDDAVPALGGASKWWLHHALKSLNKSLGGCLNIYRGHAKEVILDLVKQHHVQGFFWNRCYEPDRIHQDSEIKSTLKSAGVVCQSYNASLLWEPWNVLKQDGGFYKVYTPFYRKGCLAAAAPRKPLPLPKFDSVKDDKAISLESLGLVDRIPWHQSWGSMWGVSEEKAQSVLQDFLAQSLEGYKKKRDFPGLDHTSKLSPYLHFGQISPHQVWHAVHQKMSDLGGMTPDADHFLSELAWREFSYYLLYHFPSLPERNFQSKFDDFPWQDNPVWLQAWQKGQTGYPIVDAGMRELWQTGYMHNRVRMIVASFLIKNLGIHWHQGAAWFWDCLVDADLANNSASWQWVAGSGADAAPYFRVFNPVLQGEKFDPEGEYTKRFVPELAALPPQFLFQPWQAPQHVLKAAGVELGKDYPFPMVEMKESRDKALQNYKLISASKTLGDDVELA